MPELALHDLRSMLSKRVPCYITSTTINMIDRLPWRPNLKIDRTRFAQMDAAAFADSRSHRSSFDRRANQNFELVLGTVEATPEDNIWSLAETYSRPSRSHSNQELFAIVVPPTPSKRSRPSGNCAVDRSTERECRTRGSRIIDLICRRPAFRRRVVGGSIECPQRLEVALVRELEIAYSSGIAPLWWSTPHPTNGPTLVMTRLRLAALISLICGSLLDAISF